MQEVLPEAYVGAAGRRVNIGHFALTLFLRLYS